MSVMHFVQNTRNQEPELDLLHTTSASRITCRKLAPYSEVSVDALWLTVSLQNCFKRELRVSAFFPKLHRSHPIPLN